MKPNHRNLTIIAVATSLVLAASSAQAAVTFIGTLTNDLGTQVSNWSLTTTTKTLDIDANNYYGTDGYSWINNNNSGSPTGVLASLTQSAPSYAPGGIVYSGAGTGVSGSFSGAQDRRLPDGTGTTNVGYAGPNYNGTTGATVLQQLFSYTLNRNMFTGETIRVGVVLDSYNDSTGPIIGTDALRLVAGGTNADATLAGNRNSVMDMYFFDVTGLTSGEQIQIWGKKNADSSNFGFNAITIGGVTFDSVVAAAPEPSITLLGGLGLLSLVMRRRRNL